MICGDSIGLIAASDDGFRLRHAGFSFDENRALRANEIPSFEANLKTSFPSAGPDAELHG